jgi:hypothetical protein
LQEFGQDIRRVRPQGRAEEFTYPGCGQLGEVLNQIVLGVTPWKVVVRLRKPQLGEFVHDLRARECLSQENRFWLLRPDLRHQPLPHGKRFGMGVIDTENTHALFGPEQDHDLRLNPLNDYTPSAVSDVHLDVAPPPALRPV